MCRATNNGGADTAVFATVAYAPTVTGTIHQPLYW